MSLGRKNIYAFSTPRKPSEQRNALRKNLGNTNGWIRLEGGFAVRPCRVIDISDTGVQFSTESASAIPSTFIFLMSKTAAGRRATVKWRRGTLVGAEFSDGPSFTADSIKI